MRINDKRIKYILSSEDLKISVMSSIVGKYIFMEFQYGEEIFTEELESIQGETLYFKTEDEAMSFLDKLKNN
jgi:hypothetical protein